MKAGDSLIRFLAPGRINGIILKMHREKVDLLYIEDWHPTNSAISPAFAGSRLRLFQGLNQSIRHSWFIPRPLPSTCNIESPTLCRCRRDFCHSKWSGTMWGKGLVDHPTMSRFSILTCRPLMSVLDRVSSAFPNGQYSNLHNPDGPPTPKPSGVNGIFVCTCSTGEFQLL